MSDIEEHQLFHFRGKTFDNEDDFYNYVKRWQDLPIDMEWYKKTLEDAYFMLEVNVSGREHCPISNRMGMKLLALHFGFTDGW